MADFVNTIDVLGDDALTDSFIDRSITECNDNIISTIGEDAFLHCRALTTVSFPVATTIGGRAFYWCSALTTVSFPVVTSIGTDAFYNCQTLTSADFPAVTSIGSGAFYNNFALTAVILRNTTQIATLGGNGIGVFYRSPCNIYVPSALVDSYKAATNWSEIAQKFRALEDYTVDGTTTGELDPTKI